MNSFFELLAGGLTFVVALVVGCVIIMVVMFIAAHIFMFFYKK